MKSFLHAFRRLVLVWGATCVILGSYFTFHGVRHLMGAWEAEHWPVLADIPVCDGRVDTDSGECLGTVVVFASFAQTEAHCDGRDALVSGVMSKVRSDAAYADGRQQIFYGDPNGVRIRPEPPSGVRAWVRDCAYGCL